MNKPIYQSGNQSIIQNSTYKFHGGVHPAQHKSISNNTISKTLSPSNVFVIPIQQSSIQINDIEDKVIVKKNQSVIYGEALTVFTEEDVYVPIHSPCNGIVKNIEHRYCGHPSGNKEVVIIIEASQDFDYKINSENNSDWINQSTQSLLGIIQKSGIVGLGGAMFPTHIKQASQLKKKNKKIPTLIVNAMECEPYITCDDRLIREESINVILGALITAKITACEKIIFAIEDNKKEAILALENSIKSFPPSELNTTLSILITPTIYPSGSEKQLIKLVTGLEISKTQLPKDIDLVIQNVATLYSIYQAIEKNKNLTERLITITGDLVKQPANYWIPFGTPISNIADSLEIDINKLEHVIMGGPMMGEKYTDLSIPVSKKTNCLIFNQSVKLEETKDCIRCGECNIVCPMNLLPQQLYWYAQTEQWDAIEEYQLTSCIDCGACDFVCPSNIPLVDYFKYAKSEIKYSAKKESKSLIAKQRFDSREQRLERIKVERKNKQKKKAEDRKKATENKAIDPDGKKSAILAALNRVKKKTAVDEKDAKKEPKHE